MSAVEAARHAVEVVRCAVMAASGGSEAAWAPATAARCAVMAARCAATAACGHSLAAVAPAESAFRAVVSAKDTAREELVVAVRALAKTIQAKPTVSDGAKTTIADTTKTPVAIPTTAPVGRIEQPNRLEHNLHFADATTPTSKAKPAGVRGCQIWVKIGTTPPASVSELNDLATDTRTPYIAQFDAADAGKTAYYWLRWENTKGETGPWSAAVSATITG